MTTSPVRGVLFDAAGTLIHPRESVGATYARFARQHGARIPASRLDEAFQRVLPRAPAMVFPDLETAALHAAERDWWRRVVRDTFRAADQTELGRLSSFERCFEALFAHFSGADAWRVTERAPEALAALRDEGRRVGVASNFDHRLAPLLAELGLTAHLDVVLIPADLGAAKPEAAFFHAACRALGLEPAQTLYVGDHPEHDHEAARAAGLRALDVAAVASLEDLPVQIAALEDFPDD